MYRKEILTDIFTLIYYLSLNRDLTDSNRAYTIKRQTRINVADQYEIYEFKCLYNKKMDHGFYECFSENDLQFATLFQNDIYRTYDIRSIKQPLAEITSTRSNSHNIPFRICRLCFGLDNLLFVSEY